MLPEARKTAACAGGGEAEHDQRERDRPHALAGALDRVVDEPVRVPVAAWRVRHAARPAWPEAHVLDVADDLVEQVGDMVVVELVDDAAPVAAADHEPEMAQQPELVRDGRALHADRERDLADRGRARVQRARMRSRLGADSAWMLSAATWANPSSPSNRVTSL